MARQVLPIVGAVVGAFFGSPQIGYAIGAVVGNLADPIVNQGPKIGETGAQTSQEGAPRAIIYGTASCTGNIIAAGPVIKSTETEDAEGGKGSEKVENEHAYRNYAIRICEGPISGILRIWEDDKLVVDKRPGSPLVAQSEQWLANKNVFLGDESQLPSIFLNLNVPPLGEHPAHRGTAYIVFGLEDLTDRRGSIPQYRFEVAKDTTEVELTRIPSVDGGVISNSGGAARYETIYEYENAATFTPLMLLTYINPPTFGTAPYNAVQRMFVRAVGVSEVIFDSGWFGDPSYQAKLDEILVLRERTDLAGTIQPWTEDIVTELHLAATVTNGRTYSYAVGVDEADESLFANNLLSITPDPEIAPEGYTYYAEVDGVGVGPDEELFAASWGPSTVSITGGSAQLGGIVSDIHSRCNVQSLKYDVSELEDAVAGLVLAGDYSGADAINTLRGPYFFDKCEYSKKLHYPKRGAAVVETLTIDDLVEEPDTSKREQALEFPKKMHLFYQHAASGYAAVKATSLRSSPDARVVGETSLQVPVVLNEDQAAQTVSKLHKVSWAEAEGEVTLSVPQSLMRLTPSDNIGLSLRGQLKRLRIERREFDAGVISLTLRHDRQSAYTSNLTGVPIPPPTLPPSTIVGDTTLAILDISSRIDTEDDLHYLSAGVGALPAWYGYALQRSLDAGANYVTVGQYGYSVIGVLIDPVSDASEYFTDNTNTVTVRLIRDGQVLNSLNEVQFLSEQGAFALEKPDGSWELLQYKDATQDSSGNYILTTLHRGLLNSGTSEHFSGSRFVLLNRVQHIPAQSAWIGQALTHRAVSLGDSPELAIPQTATYYGRSQIEWPVAYLDLVRDVSDNITVTWTPRHRFGTDDAPVASINFQGYRVTLDDGTTAVSFDTMTAGFTYDASALSDPVNVSVSALNRITGAGPATSGSV